MSYFSELDIELNNLREDVKALKARVVIERDIADYWFERCLKSEERLHDEVNNRPAGRARAGYPTTD